MFQTVELAEKKFAEPANTEPQMSEVVLAVGQKGPAQSRGWGRGVGCGGLLPAAQDVPALLNS